MSVNHLKELGTLGQSLWLDYIRRDLIASGKLRRLIEEDGLRGMTSNPSIFEKAIADSHDYDEDIRAIAFSGKGARRSTKLSASMTCRTPPTSSGLSTTGLMAKTDMSAWRSIRTWRTTLRARLRKPAGCGPRWAGRMSSSRCRQRPTGYPPSSN